MDSTQNLDDPAVTDRHNGTHGGQETAILVLSQQAVFLSNPGPAKEGQL